MITLDMLKALPGGSIIADNEKKKYRLTRAQHNPCDCWFWLLDGANLATANGGTCKRAYEGSKNIKPDIKEIEDCEIIS